MGIHVGVPAVETASFSYRPDDAVEPMIRRYGTTFNMRILGEDRVICSRRTQSVIYQSLQIVTSDPAHIQRMFATDFQGWEKGLRNP
jgi:hypothetical protein